MSGTRSEGPTFENKYASDLYRLREHQATINFFPFNKELEESMINSLDIETAKNILDEHRRMVEQLEKDKARASKKGKAKAKDTAETAAEPAADEEGGIDQPPHDEGDTRPSDNEDGTVLEPTRRKIRMIQTTARTTILMKQTEVNVFLDAIKQGFVEEHPESARIKARRRNCSKWTPRRNIQVKRISIARTKGSTNS
jgi:hypothetical protein